MHDNGPVPMDTSDDYIPQINFFTSNKCIQCHNLDKLFGDLCSLCNYNNKNNQLSKQLELPFNPITYDNLQDDYSKQKYFYKFAYEFWKEFCKITRLTHSIIVSDVITKSLIDSVLNSTTHFGKLFLSFNGFYNFSPVMYSAKNVEDYIMKYVLNRNIKGEELYIHILAQTIIDPWNVNKIEIIKKYYAPPSMPKTVRDLFKLWVNNKKFCAQGLPKEEIKTCDCGTKLFTNDVIISKGPIITHINCLFNK
jgi:hypothetical protein